MFGLLKKYKTDCFFNHTCDNCDNNVTINSDSQRCDEIYARRSEAGHVEAATITNPLLARDGSGPLTPKWDLLYPIVIIAAGLIGNSI